MSDNHRIAIMTDSTCDLPAALLAQHGISAVPLYIIWGDENLKDGVDITKAAFYDRLVAEPKLPTTSQPTPADFVKALDAVEADEVLIVTISSALSGTYNSAIQARELVTKKLHVVDSLSTSYGLGWQVMAAVRVREQGGTVEEMIAAADAVRANVSLLFTVDTLEYLHKGGRIGGAARLLGTALQLKPMLCLDPTNGKIDAVERTRTRAKALRRIVDATFEKVDPTRPIHLCVLHARAEREACTVMGMLKERCQPVEEEMAELCPALGTHVGPGLVGVVAYND